MSASLPPLPTADSLRWRHRLGRLFEWGCAACTWSGLVIIVVLLSAVLWTGWSVLDLRFLTNLQSQVVPERAGIMAGLWGSFWLLLFTAAFSVPVGVGAAVYLEEYSARNWLTRLIQINIANLAGVPSVVYGLLGLTIFVRMFGAFSAGARGVFPFGASILSGSLTLGLLILPVIIISSQEALRAIPAGIRHASMALGATRWQTIWHQVLPSALPGILTGVILSLSRAIGEAAPLVVIGAATFVNNPPGRVRTVGDLFGGNWSLPAVLYDRFTAMPIIIYDWASHSDPRFRARAAAAIVVLLTLLLLMNSIAILMRQRVQKVRW